MRMFQTTSWRGMMCALVLGVSGCMVGPEYRQPEVQLPERFGAAATTQPATQPVNLSQWWATFNDPLLTSLIERAVESNLDLKLADARLREARAARRGTASGLYPSTGANTSYRKSRTSENAFGGDFGDGGGGTLGEFGGFAPPGDVTEL